MVSESSSSSSSCVFVVCLFVVCSLFTLWIRAEPLIYIIYIYYYNNILLYVSSDLKGGGQK